MTGHPITRTEYNTAVLRYMQTCLRMRAIEAGCGRAILERTNGRPELHFELKPEEAERIEEENPFVYNFLMDSDPQLDTHQELMNVVQKTLDDMNGVRVIPVQ